MLASGRPIIAACRPGSDIAKCVFLSEQEEKEVRDCLAFYAEKMRALDPGYIAPDPKSGRPGCFVVTATLGDEDHPDVLFLRSFRDQLLVRSKLGLAFVGWYYQYGPAIARRIASSKCACSVSYLFLVAPAVRVARVITRLSRR
jgi:hypothetical protein